MESKECEGHPIKIPITKFDRGSFSVTLIFVTVERTVKCEKKKKKNERKGRDGVKGTG